MRPIIAHIKKNTSVIKIFQEPELNPGVVIEPAHRSDSFFPNSVISFNFSDLYLNFFGPNSEFNCIEIGELHYDFMRKRYAYRLNDDISAETFSNEKSVKRFRTALNNLRDLFANELDGDKLFASTNQFYNLPEPTLSTDKSLLLMCSSDFKVIRDAVESVSDHLLSPQITQRVGFLSRK